MTEDPTRSTAHPDLPSYGRVGPVDPRADPATRPAMLPADPASGDGPTGPQPDLAHADLATTRTPLPDVIGPDRIDDDTPTVATPTGPVKGSQPIPGLKHTRTSWLWTGLILSAVVLILLLVFILQNGALVQINFLGFSGSLPTGVALLFSAIAGLLLVAIPGGLRILQLRRAAKRGARRPV